jgi:hypothetical protein
VEVLRRRLQPVLAAIDPQLPREHGERVRGFKQQLAERAASLKIQSEQEDPKPPEFDENGNMHLGDWYTASESEDAAHEEAELAGDKKAYAITCGPGGNCVASWRRRIMLGRGAYIFHASVQTKDVASIEDEKGSGAGIRISGANRTNRVEGTKDWTPLEFEINIEEELAEVELVAELRTTAGKAWFDRDSLHLSRKPAMPEDDSKSQ